jgi:hypothetical protein
MANNPKLNGVGPLKPMLRPFFLTVTPLLLGVVLSAPSWMLGVFGSLHVLAIGRVFIESPASHGGFSVAATVALSVAVGLSLGAGTPPLLPPIWAAVAGSFYLTVVVLHHRGRNGW